MARYIDADALIKKIFPYDIVDKKDYSINAKAVADAIDNIPTADVVPKSEVEELKRENESFAKTVNEASELIRKQRTKIEKVKAEGTREIFEEIDRMCIDTFGNFNHRVFAELKKKYTED